jgi:hypothetical protein
MFCWRHREEGAMVTESNRGLFSPCQDTAHRQTDVSISQHLRITHVGFQMSEYITSPGSHQYIIITHSVNKKTNPFLLQATMHRNREHHAGCFVLEKRNNIQRHLPSPRSPQTHHEKSTSLASLHNRSTEDSTLHTQHDVRMEEAHATPGNKPQTSPKSDLHHK